MEGKAVNVIMFNVRGLNLFNGQLKIEASFKTASKSVESLSQLFFPSHVHTLHFAHIDKSLLICSISLTES